MNKAAPILMLCALATMPGDWSRADEQPLHESAPSVRFSGPTTTFEKFLPLALEGDAEVQNFIGHMFFYGEGTEQDFEEAHMWFHRAAEQGNPTAQRNLGLFHSGTAPGVPVHYQNAEEASRWMDLAGADVVSGESHGAPLMHPPADGDRVTAANIDKGELEIGAKAYQTFCAGCHGADGTGTYAQAPSFARGERLDKSDEELMRSMTNGKGAMPAWNKTLPQALLSYTLAYVRVRIGGAAGASEPSKGSLEAIGANPNGEKLFTKFCAGCHGFNGIAYYVNSPSFALGERMEKSDLELLRSIASGIGEMPGWDNMLSSEQRREILRFVRGLQSQFKVGIASGLRPPAALYFRFRPIGVTEREWGSAEPVDVR
jgi:mono/diheme cytochrome c family protein